MQRDVVEAVIVRNDAEAQSKAGAVCPSHAYGDTRSLA